MGGIKEEKVGCKRCITKGREGNGKRRRLWKEGITKDDKG